MVVISCHSLCLLGVIVCPPAFFPLGRVCSSQSQFLDWGTEALCGMTSGCRFRQAPWTGLRPCLIHDGNYFRQPGEFTAWNSANS